MKTSLSNTTLLLVSLFLVYTTTATTTSSSFIKESCTTTTYPQVCYATLSGYSSEIRTSLKALATKSLSVALTEAKSASQLMIRLSRIHGMRAKEAAPLSDCTTAMENSAAQLRRAVEELSGGSSSAGTQPSSEMVMSDLQTWTSTALTYAGTCMDGFGERDMNGNVKIIVRKKVTKMTQLTSNALALVNSYGDSMNRASQQCHKHGRKDAHHEKHP